MLNAGCSSVAGDVRLLQSDLIKKDKISNCKVITFSGSEVDVNFKQV